MVQRRRLPSATYTSPFDELWTRDHFADQTICIHARQHEPADIARHVAEKQTSQAPFFVMNVPSVTEAVDQWQKNLDRFQPFYALRCNSDPVLALLLAETHGMGFEVINRAELNFALRFVHPEKIVFSCPLWRKNLMKLAGEARVGTVVVGTESELFDIANIARYSRILLAVNIPGCQPRQDDFEVGFSFDEAVEMLKMMRDVTNNFDGFSFNIDNQDSSMYFKAMKMIQDLWKIAEENGLSPSTINVGGGFKAPNNKKDHFHEVSRDLNEAVDLFFSHKTYPFLKLMATPGRFFATSAFSLCTNVIGKKEVETMEDSFFIYQTNDGLYGSFECRLADCEPKCRPLYEKTEKETAMGVILGPTMDTYDIVKKPSRIRQLSVGDWLIWDDMGAYTIAAEDDENENHPVYYFTGKDNWDQLAKRRLSNQLDNIAELGSDADSVSIISEEDLLFFDKDFFD